MGGGAFEVSVGVSVAALCSCVLMRWGLTVGADPKDAGAGSGPEITLWRGRRWPAEFHPKFIQIPARNIFVHLALG